MITRLENAWSAFLEDITVIFSIFNKHIDDFVIKSNFKMLQLYKICLKNI